MILSSIGSDNPSLMNQTILPYFVKICLTTLISETQNIWFQISDSNSVVQLISSSTISNHSFFSTIQCLSGFWSLSLLSGHLQILRCFPLHILNPLFLFKKNPLSGYLSSSFLIYLIKTHMYWASVIQSCLLCLHLLQKPCLCARKHLQFHWTPITKRENTFSLCF